MRLSVTHTSHYLYSEPVSYALQQIRLQPQSDLAQTVEHWSVEIENGRQEAEFEDHYGNWTILSRAAEGMTELTVRCSGSIVTRDKAGILGAHQGPIPMWQFKRETPLTQAGSGVRGLLRGLSRKTDNVALMHQLSEAVRSAISYQIGCTDTTTTAEQALSYAKGVCQDHAHTFVAAARALGFPARYVSGYLLMDTGVIQDATHAWAEVFLDGLGWTGFDISNGISPDERYISLARGLDYSEAAPIRGVVLGGRAESMRVQVDVQQQ